MARHPSNWAKEETRRMKTASPQYGPDFGSDETVKIDPPQTWSGSNRVRAHICVGKRVMAAYFGQRSLIGCQYAGEVAFCEEVKRRVRILGDEKALRKEMVHRVQAQTRHARASYISLFRFAL